MQKTFLFCELFLSAAILSHAATIATGTPGNGALATPTSPSPAIGVLTSFDSLTASSVPVASLTDGSVSVSSANGLTVIPYSTMSGPNEVYDNGANGTANLNIMLAQGTNQMGVGIADLDGVTISIQALNVDGTPMGAAFLENLSTTVDNNGNSYFVVSDSGYDIFGLNITQSVANANYSGLAIDDVQAAPTPEPATFILLGAGMIAVGAVRFYKGNSKR